MLICYDEYIRRDAFNRKRKEANMSEKKIQMGNNYMSRDEMSTRIAGLQTLLESDVYKESSAELPIAIGVNVEGEIEVEDLVKLTPMLLAGTSGSGANEFLYSLILSLSTLKGPEEVKLFLVDTKKMYSDRLAYVPHIQGSIITEPVKAADAIDWLSGEMMQRYRMFNECGVQSLDAYNEIVSKDVKESGDDNGTERMALPRVIAVIDSLEDIMIYNRTRAELGIVTLLQLGADVGIHVILKTERPSIEGVTSLIKTNISGRIAFALDSKTESLIILDMPGAEKLSGAGDMLFLRSTSKRAERIQTAYISANEISDMIQDIKKRWT